MESLFPADRWQVRSRQLTALILALSAFLKDEGASRVLAACGARVSNDTVRRVIHAIWSYLRRDSLSQPLVSFFYQKLAPGFRR